MSKQSQRFKNIFFVCLSVVIIIIIGVLIISKYEKISVQDVNNQGLNKKVISGFHSDFITLAPSGVYNYNDNYNYANKAIAMGHYYQEFDGEKKKVFESGPFYSSASDVVGTTIVYSILTKEGHEFFIGDLESGVANLIGIIPSDMGYSNKVNSIGLSPDGKKIYVVITYNEEDYDVIWNDADFSYDQILLNSELFEVDVSSGVSNLIHSQQKNLATFLIEYVADKYLVMKLFNTELDRQSFGFFDTQNQQFEKIIKSDFFINYAVSPNGKFLVYQDLLSKVGDIDPLESKIIDLDTLNEINTNFLSNFDFDSLAPITTDNEWYNWTGPFWGIDNSSLYYVRGGLMHTYSKGTNVYKVDLVLQELDLFLTIPEKYNSPQVLGIYDEDVYISSVSNNKTSIYKLPKGKLIVERDGYPNLNIIAK